MAWPACRVDTGTGITDEKTIADGKGMTDGTHRRYTKPIEEKKEYNGAVEEGLTKLSEERVKQQCRHTNV